MARIGMTAPWYGMTGSDSGSQSDDIGRPLRAVTAARVA